MALVATLTSVTRGCSWRYSVPSVRNLVATNACLLDVGAPVFTVKKMTCRLETPGRSRFIHRGAILGKRLVDALNREGVYPTVPDWWRHTRVNAKCQELKQLEPDLPSWFLDQVATELVDTEIDCKGMRKLYGV